MLAYSYTENEEKQTIVFLHGFLGSSLDFEPLCKELGRSYSTLCIDLPGHGKSTHLEAVNFQNTTQMIHEVLRYLRINFAHFVGYSLGGRVLLEFTEKFPQSILSATIFSAHYKISEKERLIKIENEKNWCSLLTENSFSIFLEKWYSQEIFASFDFNKMKAQRLHNNPYALKDTMQALSITKQRNFLPFLEKSKIPFLFLSGNRDKKYTTLYKNLPTRIRKDIIPNASHAIHIENPKACAQTVIHFIKEVSNDQTHVERLLSV